MYFCRFFLLFHLTIFLFSLYYIAFAFSILYQYNLCVYVSIYRRGILKSTNELSNIQICNVLLLVLLLYKHKDTQCTLNTNETEKKTEHGNTQQRKISTRLSHYPKTKHTKCNVREAKKKKNCTAAHTTTTQQTT